MSKRIAISACALMLFCAVAVASAQQTIGDMLRGGLEVYTPTAASSETAMSNCGTTAEQLKAEGYTEEYHFKGSEEIVSVEYCQAGKTLTDTRLRLVAADTVGFLKPGDRTQVAFTNSCKNRSVLKTPPPVQEAAPPAPVAVIAPPPPPATPVPPTLIIEKEYLDVSSAVTQPVPAFTFTVTGDSFTTTVQNGADGTVRVPLPAPGCYQVAETSGSTYELLGMVPEDGKICLQAGEQKAVHFKNRQVVPTQPAAEVTPPEPPKPFRIERTFYTGEEEELSYCERDHNLFIRATAVQVVCHPVRTAIILTAACVVVGAGATVGPCKSIHYLFTGAAKVVAQKPPVPISHLAPDFVGK